MVYTGSDSKQGAMTFTHNALLNNWYPSSFVVTGSPQVTCKGTLLYKKPFRHELNVDFIKQWLLNMEVIKYSYTKTCSYSLYIT